jgi:hypothetical protein
MAACPRLVERRCHDARHVVEQRIAPDPELSAVEHHITAGATEMDARGVAPIDWTPRPQLLDDESGSDHRQGQKT